MRPFGWKMLATIVAMAALSGAPAFAQLASGPREGDAVQVLKVLAATGDGAGAEIDASAPAREGKPAVLLFVQQSTFSRPIARFLRTLDEELSKRGDGTTATVIWLTDDIDAGREYLPRAQQSINLRATAWTIHPGDTSGPAEWGINADAHLTAVVVRDRKVAGSLAWRSLNETDVPAVLEKLKPRSDPLRRDRGASSCYWTPRSLMYCVLRSGCSTTMNCPVDSSYAYRSYP